MKWVLLMLAFLPDGSHIAVKGHEPYATEMMCEKKAEELEKLMRTQGAVSVHHHCKQTLPGEEA